MTTNEDTDSDSDQRDTARPFWLTQPCPAWCDRLHHDGDPIEDRRHFSDLIEHVELSTVAASRSGTDDAVIPHCLEIHMQQGYREVAPRIMMEEHRSRLPAFELTLDEAEQTVAALTRLITMGRTNHATTGTDQDPA